MVALTEAPCLRAMHLVVDRTQRAIAPSSRPSPRSWTRPTTVSRCGPRCSRGSDPPRSRTRPRETPCSETESKVHCSRGRITARRWIRQVPRPIIDPRAASASPRYPSCTRMSRPRGCSRPARVARDDPSTWRMCTVTVNGQLRSRTLTRTAGSKRPSRASCSRSCRGRCSCGRPLSCSEKWTLQHHI